jgi:hypothetical protein
MRGLEQSDFTNAFRQRKKYFTNNGKNNSVVRNRFCGERVVSQSTQDHWVKPCFGILPCVEKVAVPSKQEYIFRRWAIAEIICSVKI